MSRSGVQLKASAGWFAAGIEVQHAATLLSDAAFKLYVWLCLHAERDRGCLQASADVIAAALQKTGDDIRACLTELDRAGVCHRGSEDLVRICDSFWPYTRAELSMREQQTEFYIREVKRLLLARLCVSTAFTSADRCIAAEWHRTGVSLQMVERAIQLGCLRKYAALINHGYGTPITTLAYFRSLIEEVTNSEAPVDYWPYVRLRLADLERRWRCQRNQTAQETK